MSSFVWMKVLESAPERYDRGIRIHYDDGRIVEASTIRTTRMNMLGRRTVKVTR